MQTDADSSGGEDILAGGRLPGRELHGHADRAARAVAENAGVGDRREGGDPRQGLRARGPRDHIARRPSSARHAALLQLHCCIVCLPNVSLFQLCTRLYRARRRRAAARVDRVALGGGCQEGQGVRGASDQSHARRRPQQRVPPKATASARSRQR